MPPSLRLPACTGSRRAVVGAGPVSEPRPAACRSSGSFKEARKRLKRGDAFRRKLVRRIDGTPLGSAQVPVDEALRSAEDRGALGGCDLSLAEGITKFVEV